MTKDICEGGDGKYSISFSTFYPSSLYLCHSKQKVVLSIRLFVATIFSFTKIPFSFFFSFQFSSFLFPYFNTFVSFFIKSISLRNE